MWWGFRSFEIGQDCYANPQLLITNRQSALGHFSIGRVGQFSISANNAVLFHGGNRYASPKVLGAILINVLMAALLPQLQTAP